MKIYKRLMLLFGIPLLLVGCGIDSSSVGDSTSLTSEMPTSQSQVTTYWDVDFDINKDISVNIDSQTIIHNGKATNPSYTYTQNDDTFLGWYKDRYSLEKWNFNSDKVTADRTLYGGWQSIVDSYVPDTSIPDDEYNYYDPDFFPKTYAVFFDSNYEGGPIIERNITENNIVRAPSMTRSGYRLVNWFSDRTLTTPFNFETPINSSFTLYASWEALATFSVTFDYNYQGSPIPTTITAYDGLKIARPNDPVRAGYDFIGWYKDTNFNTVWNFSFDVVSSDITLYGRWSRQPLPGVYVLMSDLWMEDSATFILWHGTSTVNKDGIPTGVPNEYYFDNAATNYLALKRYVGTTAVGQVHSIAPNGGWGQTWNQIIVQPTTPKTGSLVASSGDYVKLVMRDNTVDENLTTHTVIFDFNYSGAPSVQSKTILDGQKVSTISAPLREGYDFIGWSLSQSGLPLYDFNLPVESDLRLYAIWEEKDISNQVSITFNQNYQGAPAVTTQIGYIGELLTEPTGINRTGYTLLGWYLEASGTTKWNFSSDLIMGAMTLYAKWSENVTPTNNGVYLLVNANWAEENATFELEFIDSPNGRRTVIGVATDRPNEYFFEEVPRNAMILVRKVNGVQKAKIYNIATWVQSGADYRNYGTTWNRIVINPSLANNVANEPATNAVTYDVRPNVQARIRTLLFVNNIEENTYEN